MENLPTVEATTALEAYAEAMSKAWEQYPDDANVGMLYAEALMVLSPWDYYWPDGTPRPGTAAAAQALELVMLEHPDHPGATHYYIHLDVGSQPEQSIPTVPR